MNQQAKQRVLLCLLAGLIALLLLSASLSDLHLRPGEPIPGAAEASRTLRAASSQLTVAVSWAPLAGALFGIVLIILMIYVPARLLSLIDLRKLLAWLIAIVAMSVLLSVLPSILLQLPSSGAASSPNVAVPSPSTSPAAVISTPPSVLIWLTAGCFVVGAGILAARLLREASRSKQAQDELSDAAEKALRDLSMGIRFSNVIVRCYLQMDQILRAERKLERHHTMTVREFERWLERNGIPADPVHRLTTLFEKARYGNEPMSPADEETGTECLRQIIQYCRKGQAGN